MIEVFSGAVSVAAAALWPPRCPVCRVVNGTRTIEGLCGSCLADFRYMRDPICKVCGRTLPENAPESGVCGFCSHQPPFFDLARVYGVYDGPLALMIKAFKFRERRAHLAPLRRMIVKAFEVRLASESFDFIVPVPLHRERIRRRGFNQSADLARGVSQNSGVPLRLGLINRIKNTQPQVGLKAKERRENLKGAFALSASDEVKGRAVLVVDDVITSGATMNECAKVLKRAGASRVAALAVAGAMF